MKKLAKIFAVVLVCVLAVTALVACAPAPNTNYDKAQENLKENKYTVMAIKEGDVGFALAVVTPATIYGIKVEDIEAILSATNADGESVAIIWCKSADAAKTAYDKANSAMKDRKKDLDDLKAEIAEMEDGAQKENAQKTYDEMKKAYDNSVVGHSGKIVWTGTKEGIKATK